MRVVKLACAALLVAGMACSDSDNEKATSTTVKRSTTTALAATTTASEVPRTTTKANVAALSEESPLRFDGIGAIKVGMTLDQASDAIGRPVRVDPNEQQVGDGSCIYATAQNAPEQLRFMVLDGKIQRIDVSGSGPVATEAGATVGVSESELQGKYGGKLERRKHPYNEQGRYLSTTSGPNELLFETDGKQVTSFRAGQTEAVEYIEGCA